MEFCPWPEAQPAEFELTDVTDDVVTPTIINLLYSCATARAQLNANVFQNVFPKNISNRFVLFMERFPNMDKQKK